MRKRIVLALAFLCLAVLAGCAKDKQGEEQPGEVTGQVTSEVSDVKFETEDYEPGNRSYHLPREMMRTDKGFYHYNSKNRSLHYYDLALGKEMYLCNKPECRHDGNAFCVATSQRYELLGNSLYNDKILSYAMAETETQYVFKLLTIALDGSAMDELATVLTLEKTAEKMLFGWSKVHIHRNKVLLTMAGGSVGGDTFHYLAAVVDLDTKDIVFLNEEPFSKENEAVTDISAYGDYFYYCQMEGKKTVLHRYHIGTGTIETCKLLTNFKGRYAVLDEDRVVYLRSTGRSLCTYRFSTGENEEKEFAAEDVLTDGTYLFVPQGTPTITTKDENGELVTRTPAYINVLDKNLEEIVEVNMEEYLPLPGFEEMVWHTSTYNRGLRYLGEDIYWCLSPIDNPETTTYVFHCKRSDFLAGEPKFEFVYQYNES